MDLLEGGHYDFVSHWDLCPLSLNFQKFPNLDLGTLSPANGWGGWSLATLHEQKKFTEMEYPQLPSASPEEFKNVPAEIRGSSSTILCIN